MTKKQDGWISRRGQTDAATAIDLVLDLQQGEAVQQIADELIEDSPYQARRAVSDADVEELAQGMRTAGFQGVLIVRPHGDLSLRRQGRFQLVYGHRRRMAWRRVCLEHGTPCLLPVVVRTIDDAQLLTVGAQENVQRRDLDPIEEGQIVAWLERMFPSMNQAALGALLGKSSDWVSVRSRVFRMPDVLKGALQQRPRAIAQMLEINTLFAVHPDAATALADQVIRENLSLDAVRAAVRGYARPERSGSAVASAAEQSKAAPTPEQGSTSESRREGAIARARAEPPDEPAARTAPSRNSKAVSQDTASEGETTYADPQPARRAAPTDDSDLMLLEEAAAALALVASRATELPIGQRATEALAQIERALMEIRRACP
jgi:ParB/RepB/Spo0J family partition protein